jgi:hypothetical protein
MTGFMSTKQQSFTYNEWDMRGGLPHAGLRVVAAVVVGLQMHLEKTEGTTDACWQTVLGFIHCHQHLVH